jgi:hypothetical protein
VSRQYPRTLQIARREAARRVWRIFACALYAAGCGENQRQSNISMGYEPQSYVRMLAKQAWDRATDEGRLL